MKTFIRRNCITKKLKVSHFGSVINSNAATKMNTFIKMPLPATNHFKNFSTMVHPDNSQL